MSDYDWDDNERPLAYFITFRTHGSWLHGDQHGSVERHGRNIYGADRIKLDPVFSVKMEQNMSSEPFLLNGPQRSQVESAIRGVCLVRGYGLFAINVRTNHAHVVVSAGVAPKIVMNAFKANATRELRQAGLVALEQSIWSRGGSTRYLWKPRSIEAAVEYTINGQGDDLPKF
ncbi:MAG TPA: transposase [Pyrinomonadaceae bacterium]|nr:transposase [Pyrinomonadaceae bacterium]